MNDMYKRADEAIRAINRQIVREYNRMGAHLGFDELNILQARRTISEAFSRIDRVARRGYRRLSRRVYEDFWLDYFAMYGREPALSEAFAGDFLKNHDPVTGVFYDDSRAMQGRERREALPESFTGDFLKSYDPVTGVVYENKWVRKRDRLFENMQPFSSKLVMSNIRNFKYMQREEVCGKSA